MGRVGKAFHNYGRSIRLFTWKAWAGQQLRASWTWAAPSLGKVQVTPKDISSSVLFANWDWTPKNCPNKPKPDGSQFFLSFVLSFPINDFFFKCQSNVY